MSSSKASIGGLKKDILKIDSVASLRCCQFLLKKGRFTAQLSPPTVFKISGCVILHSTHN